MTSSRGASGSADSGTNRSVPTSASAAKTTLTPKIDRHERPVSSAPETSSPKIAAPPATAAQMLTALVRFAGGNVPVIVDNVAGITSAAPKPITPRNPISSVAESAVIATADPTPKITSPAISATRRP